jgi:hypothetical protein
MRTENRKEKEKPTVSNQGFAFVVNSYTYIEPACFARRYSFKKHLS